MNQQRWKGGQFVNDGELVSYTRMVRQRAQIRLPLVGTPSVLKNEGLSKTQSLNPYFYALSAGIIDFSQPGA